MRTLTKIKQASPRFPNRLKASYMLVAVIFLSAIISFSIVIKTPQVRAATIVAGPNTSGTNCTNIDTGSSVSWNAGGMGNTTSSDNAYAFITNLDPYDINGGDDLRCNNFGFSIPS